ncbi:MAG TPA: Spy/CpxP family protein refolding chaperone [Stellaceae bacterium]|nr:Spy/CpxP family protein refolding chaperone [Stellaceae bacterium]
MMNIRRTALVAALLAGVGAVGIAPAFAEVAPAPANAGAAQMPAHRHTQRMLPGQRVAGQIAYLKAELKITPAQDSLWTPVAQAMRDNAQALDQAILRARQEKKPLDAVQRISLRESFAKTRSENEARFLASFKPLYAALSPAQQQAANELFAPHHGWHRRA